MFHRKNIFLAVERNSSPLCACHPIDFIFELLCTFSKYKCAIQLALLKHSYLNYLYLFTYSTLKALGICTEGFRIRADFL